jgi:hypothetical protein
MTTLHGDKLRYFKVYFKISAAPANCEPLAIGTELELSTVEHPRSELPGEILLPTLGRGLIAPMTFHTVPQLLNIY